jgi:Tol biopolymer transport system component
MQSDGNYEIYVMNADGSDPRNLTRHPERDDFAAWHPSGKQLVTVSECAGYVRGTFHVPAALCSPRPKTYPVT